jgi:hypothetical protein
MLIKTTPSSQGKTKASNDKNGQDVLGEYLENAMQGEI